MTAHTPGPWAVDYDSEGPFVRMEALAGDDEFFCVYGSTNTDQQHADARLVAAAPDLLAAIDKALDAISAVVNSEDMGGDDWQRWSENELPTIHDTLLTATKRAKGIES